MSVQFCLMSPGGNDTAIVTTDVSRASQVSVAAAIQAAYPAIEQVLFLEDRQGQPAGQMAGGEFCGNAARALGFYLLDGKPGSVQFPMSGTALPVRVDVNEGAAALAAPVAWRETDVCLVEDAVFCVALEGIVHYIATEQSAVWQVLAKMDPARATAFARDWIRDRAPSETPAGGLILTTWASDAQGMIVPYVWVRSTDTIYAETACGSGSLAAAIVRARAGLDMRFTLAQPSGMNLTVTLDSDGASAVIDGPVQTQGIFQIADLYQKMA